MKLHSSNPNQTNRSRRAFTLVEMLLVVTIIGILAALVIPNLIHRAETARITKTKADINGGIKSTLDRYEIENGFYPKSLQDLLVQPGNAKNWRGPYFDPPKLPMDPWGNPYVYYYPGKRNQTSYELFSTGPDAKEGTDDDIGNWVK